MALKAFELLKQAPEEIKGFKKLSFDNWESDYFFELGSGAERAFYATLEAGTDDKQLLWYENGKKAYCLFVSSDEDGEAEFVTREMDMWMSSDSEKEYDGIDDTPESFESFEDAVVEFLELLENYG